MEKHEFLDFCRIEFEKRGFRKRKKMYYLQGKDLLCGLYLQKSICDGYYVEYDFFVGAFEDVKSYPTKYDSDVYQRMTVLSRDTINGEHFMTSLIEYEFYNQNELRDYFDREFEMHIMPPLIKGKRYLLNELDFYELTEEKEVVLKKKIEENNNKIMN